MKKLFFSKLIFCILFTSSLQSQNEVRIVKELGPGAENGLTDDAQIIGTVANSILIADSGNFITSNGTDPGTVISGELGEGGRILHHKTTLNDKLYFLLENETEDFQLMEFDPFSGSINTILSGYDNISNLIAYNGKLYCSAEGNDEDNAFISIDLSTGNIETIFELNSFGGMRDVAIHNNLIYTIHWSATQDGAFLASSDGTPGNVNEFYFFHDGSDFSQGRTINMTSADENLFMWYDNGPDNYTLFVSDGTASGTIELSNSFVPISFFDIEANRGIGTLGNKILFRGEVDGDSDENLWVSDGTISGTFPILIDGELEVKPRFFTTLNDKIYFNGAHTNSSFGAISGAMVSDGTESGTKRLFQGGNHPEDFNNDGWHIITHQDKLFFAANNSLHANELYASDGTLDGTERLSTIGQENEFSSVFNLRSAGENLFFFGNFDASGRELYVYGPTTSSIYNIVDHSLDVFPNPVDNILNINSDFKNVDQIEIYDFEGKLIKTFLQPNRRTLDVQDLTKGSYLLKVRQGQDISTSKFVKL